MRAKQLLPKLKKLSFKHRKHHYTLRSTDKKRQLAINEGIKMEAKKIKKTLKKSAIAIKNRLNILRIYRKTKKVKECNKITKDMRYIDSKYKLGKTNNICGKHRKHRGGTIDDLSFQNLVGPISMYYIEVEPNTKIMLLGDNHESGKFMRPLIAENKYSDDVTYVHNWLHKLGTSSDKCIDVLMEFESGYTDTPDYTEDRYIDLGTSIKDRAGRYVKASFLSEELGNLEDVYSKVALNKMRIHHVNIRTNYLRYSFHEKFYTKDNVNAVFNYLFDENSDDAIDNELAKNYKSLKPLFSKMISKSSESLRIIGAVKKYINSDIRETSEGALYY